MYDVGGKLLNGVKSIHVNSLAYLNVKRVERDYFGMERAVMQECVMSPRLFSMYMMR